MPNIRPAQLVDELARASIARIEPDEAELVDAALAELSRFWNPRSGSLGYGISEVADFISPYVVVAATWVAATTFDEARKTLEKRLRKLVRRLLRDVDADQLEVKELPSSQSSGQDIESGVAQLLHQLQLDPERTAVVARVVVSEFLARRP